jgi:hypothetical protein
MRKETDSADLSVRWAGAIDLDSDAEMFGSLGWWLTGGASLLLWTGIALLLTSA